MPTTNQALAQLFQEMADVMTILGVDAFKVGAFQKVSRALEEHPEDVASIGPDEKKLQAIPGVGKGSAARIAEYLKTGKIKDHEDLLSQFPPALVELLRVPGLGPKTVGTVWRECGITCLEDLKAAVQGDRLLSVPGFGAKKLEALRKNLTFLAAAGARVRIGAALPVAQWFVDQLRRVPGVKEAAYAGSLRRGKETIGDIDLLVSAELKEGDPHGLAQSIGEAFTKLGPVSEVLGRGDTKVSIRTSRAAGELQVDLRILAPECFGAALLYFTGSKEHNVALRERAVRKNLRLNEYGLFRGNTGERPAPGEKPVACATEEDVYKALGLAWVPPELREDRGEVELAAKNALPALVEQRDILAELHAHTTASDGTWSIEELAHAAIERGFHTVAVTDHSKSQPQANGLSAERLERHILDVRAAAARLKGKITILAGTEVDILADGTLDYPNSLLKELDIVVASPHAALSQEPEKATARLLKAISNPYVTIMGHPTGRLVARREGIHPDINEVVKAAAQRGVALEINANHHRLDLRDTHARAALEAGVKLAINCDAHAMVDLDELRYGVLTARRAGARKQDVVNCLDRAALGEWLRSTRG